MNFLENNNNTTIILICILSLFFTTSCEEKFESPPKPSASSNTEPDENTDRDLVEGVDYFLPKIDLHNWKVTLPIPRSDGKPLEVEPPEILDYANDVVLKDFMFNDSTDGALVFYTYPGVTTTNSSYSRTELREQMVPGSNSTNWTFDQGGRMKGTLKLEEISTEPDGDPHRTMVMQIHGRLTNAQRDLIGASDNNAPPMLKIYWEDGKVRVRTKVLNDLNASDTEILYTNAWGNDDAFTFSEAVNNDKFTVEIIASAGKMEVILNDNESVIYDGIHIEKWGVFENYFKAGNYLVTTDDGSFAKVKYYELEISH